jgi:polysaccharide deacetylase family protein (PEP-CTERM system associated)
VRVHGFGILGGYEHLIDMIMAGGVDAIVLTHESLRAAALESLCARYGVALFRLRLEWLELSAPQPAAEPEVASIRVVDRLPVLPVPAETTVRHAFSVDVEDWFHGIPVGLAMKESATPRLERGLHVLLDLLGERGARATFFILGPLVKNHSAVLRRIAAEGHELGCHGWSHELVYNMTPEQFSEDARQARDAISDLTGRPVEAFRAPYFSITRSSLWALEVLAELGFKYDSSIFPVRNWRYGIPDFSRDPVLLTTPSGPLWEFPISVIERYGQTIPVSGGAYFRLYPYSLTRANFKAQERTGRSVLFYLHPWELDPHHPQVAFEWKPHLTHYANLQSSRPKLVRLLRDFSFGTIGEVIAARA